MRERVTKRKLPFTVGANGEQKDSDTGTSLGLTLYPRRSLAVAISPVCAAQPRVIPVRARDRPLGHGYPCPGYTEQRWCPTATRAHGLLQNLGSLPKSAEQERAWVGLAPFTVYSRANSVLGRSRTGLHIHLHVVILVCRQDPTQGPFGSRTPK